MHLVEAARCALEGLFKCRLRVLLPAVPGKRIRVFGPDDNTRGHATNPLPWDEAYTDWDKSESTVQLQVRFCGSRNAENGTSGVFIMFGKS